MLIRDGATLVRSAQDVIEAVGEATPPQAPIAPEQTTLPLESEQTTPKRTLRETSDLHMQILNRLGQAPLDEDQLILYLATSANKVTPILVDLELEGRITRQAGGLLSRT